MKNTKFFRVLLIFATLLASCSTDDTTPVTTTPEDPIIVVPPDNDLLIEQRLQAIIDSKIAEGSEKLVGVSMSIRVDGIERWNLNGGVSKENFPIHGDLRFGIGSITKTAVAATILKLEEEGVLSLDDTIGDWLTLNSQNIDDSITIFQLLSHFAGLREYLTNTMWNRVESNLDTYIPQIELVDYVGVPNHPPGETHKYSNTHYLILGLIIEAATNKTVGEVMREKFWAPLGFNNTYFASNEAVSGVWATPWRDSNGDGILEDILDQYRAAYFSVFYCAGGMFSTSSDLSKWVYELYVGNALSQTSKDKMFTSYFDIPHPIFIGYGLGTRKNIYGGKVMWGHTGGVRGYGSHMFYEPTSKISVAIVNNQSRSTNGPQLRHELFDEIMTLLFAEL